MTVDPRHRAAYCLTSDALFPDLCGVALAGVDRSLVAQLGIPVGSDVMTAFPKVRECAARYLVTVSLDDPRLIMRSDSGIADRSLWRTHRAAAGERLKAIPRRPVCEVWVESARRPALVDAVLTELGLPAAGVTVSCGTAGANRRPVPIVLDDQGRSLAVGRTAFDDDERRRLSTECAVLGRVRSDPSLAKTVPRQLGNLDLATFRCMMAEPGPRRSGLRRLSAVHLRWLAQLQASWGTESRRVLETTPFREAQALLQARREPISPIDVCAAERLLEYLARDVDAEVRTSLAHRDFVHWNTRLTDDGRLYVFDWEYAAEGYPVGTDAIHFQVIRVLARGSGSGDTLHRMLKMAAANSGLREGESVDREIPLYLLGLWSTYASAWAQSPVGSRNVLNGIARVAELLAVRS